MLPEPTVHPVRKLRARLVACLVGDLPDFRTRPVEQLVLAPDGAEGDGHRGFTRPAGAREPWYPRDTAIRSGRQLSIVSLEDLREVAAKLSIAEVDPALIGANLVVEGIARFSLLPAGTRLFFPSGASVLVEGINAPCRHAGKALAEAHPGREDIALGFVAAAAHRRGVVASVERPGPIAAGDAVSARLPEQWIYSG